MLADSVEAAVRSMPDKTKPNWRTHKKNNQGQAGRRAAWQLQSYIKDLDSIAKAFMKVFSGVFHSREEYPDIKKKEDSVEDVNNENEQKDQNPKTESLE